jgi:hypothetical protein
MGSSTSFPKTTLPEKNINSEKTMEPEKNINSEKTMEPEKNIKPEKTIDPEIFIDSERVKAHIINQYGNKYTSTKSSVLDDMYNNVNVPEKDLQFNAVKAMYDGKISYSQMRMFAG